MMMITKMTKVSLFVLAGMISGSSASAIDCSQFDHSACLQHRNQCGWVQIGALIGFCENRSNTSASSFVSLEEDYVVDKNIDYDDNDNILQQAAVTGDECDFGSNYTIYHISSDFCSFDVGIGIITNFEESNTISSGDTNVTTITQRGDSMAIWKMGDKDSTLQCYSDVTFEVLSTKYPNGSTFKVSTGDFAFGLDSNDTVADGVPLSIPGLYYFKGGHVEFWIDNDGIADFTKAEGDITDLCEVLGGGAAPAPTHPIKASLGLADDKRSYLRAS